MWNDDNGLDRVIDDVAREMTAADPPTNAGAFRVRVVARLGQRKASRAVLWILSPIAVAALIFIVVRLTSDTRTERVRLKADTTTDTARVTRDTTTVETPEAHAMSASNPSVSGSRRTRAGRQLANAVPPSEVEALAPARLTVESIDLTAIEPAESIRLPQLETIAPITVAPIGEPQGERP